MQHTTVTYDGSFDGFLTAVFEIYERRLSHVIIKSELQFESELFGIHEHIITDDNKSKRVFDGLKKHIGAKGCNILYYSFLSEIIGIESKKNIISDYSNPDVLQLSKVVKKVGREKHRMEAFVRFQQTKDNIYFANVEPDFNVLPLIKNHFTKRYADQKWIIYDLKRKYGLFYNLESTEVIYIDFNIDTKQDWFTENEKTYETLWKDYFESTNIEERINTKLHVRHVPKRYWKYLSEKQP
jgi:probable DNA metabolism protein